MDIITNWSAVRSGARITIRGTDGAGAPIKVSVDEIVNNGRVTVAMDRKDGASYALREAVPA